ncbi:hypothetical protein [Fodinibius saliphilus]|uniref:hypothetical protein n=1 Tax=Fodinibius saliphilus TaxID=1920650 RepID=UPI00110928B7|nr:hypothetical protein [Fodinibius saliphilus]
MKATKDKREKFIDQFAEKLKEWNKDLEKLENNLDEEYEELKSEYKGRIKELNRYRDEMETKIEKIEDVSSDRFESIKNDLNKLWDDSINILKSLKAKIKNS